MRRSASVAVTTIATVGLALPAVAGPAFNNKYESSDHVHECMDDQGTTQATITYNGPDRMWPPNHKEQPITIVARDVDANADDNDVLELIVTISDDETADGEEMNGSGNTPENSSFAGGGAAEDETSGSGYIRSERSGRGDGRTYTISYTVNDSDGEQDMEGFMDISCTGEFLVEVPHDMRGGGGQEFGGSGNGQGNGGGGGGGLLADLAG